PAERDDSAVASLLNALSEVNRVVVVKLAPLDKNGIGELVDSLTLPDVVGTVLAASLARHTGGNPLFVLETLKEALIGGFDGRRLPQPLGVVESIARRVASLYARAQHI